MDKDAVMFVDLKMAPALASLSLVCRCLALQVQPAPVKAFHASAWTNRILMGNGQGQRARGDQVFSLV